MEDFIKTVSNQATAERLAYILRGRKPMRNFKYEVESNFDIRDDWFAYRDARYEVWVEEQIEILIEQESEDEEE